MKHSTKNKILVALATALFLSGSASSAPRVQFLWSEDSAELFDTQTAAWETPVSMPPNAIHWKYDRARAQESFRKMYPQDRQVIRQIQVSPANVELTEVEQAPVFTIDRILTNPTEDF